ncbi:MAG: Hsp33 family molecular chaperone HslO [Clostridiales bacterium]|nr:Hsp33 family molecular chaperone HslO [Clostridiales bacterium]
MADPYFVEGMPTDPSKDHFVKAKALGGFAKACAIRSTEIVRTAQQLHGTSPSVTAALGRFMTGSLLISENMKNDTDTQTTIIKSDGPIRGMTCVCDSSFHCRAYPVNSSIEGDTEPHVKAAVGMGTLSVIRDIGMREPYGGQVELKTGGIGEDFTYYLMASEQTPTIMALGVLMEEGKVKHAGGLMVQLMPGYGEEEISYLEKRANGFPDVTYFLDEGFSPAQLIDLFMGDPEMEYIEASETSFLCPCSKDKMAAGLMTLSRKDLEELAGDSKGIDTECRFCNGKYHFTPEEIRAML